MCRMYLVSAVGRAEAIEPIFVAANSAEEAASIADVHWNYCGLRPEDEIEVVAVPTPTGLGIVETRQPEYFSAAELV